MRLIPFGLIVLLALVSAGLAVRHPWAWWGVGIFGALALLGVWNLLQSRHTLLRNYPVIGHIRWLFEELRPYLRPSTVESAPRAALQANDERALVYQRSKTRARTRCPSAPSSTSIPTSTTG